MIFNTLIWSDKNSCFNHIFAEFAGIDLTKNSVKAPMDNTAISLLELDDDQNHIIRYWNDRAHVADILQ